MERLHVEVLGGDERPALLLLHGFLSCNLQWEPNRELLSQHFRLVMAELFGHGKSPAPGDAADYRVERYVEEFERIRASLGVSRWLVCGQSFGAGVMIRYALAHPEALRGLVITNSRSALNDLAARSGRRDAADFEAIDPRSLPFHPCHAKRFPPELKARMEAAADEVPRMALGHAVTTTGVGVACRALAPRLAVPTLLVNGRFEKVFQPDRDFAAASISGIEVVDLDAGHSVNIEAADGFGRALIDFGRRHS